MLAPYLSYRGQNNGDALMRWYHRQLWETAEAHFLCDADFRAACHHVLAEFFSGFFSSKEKPCNDTLRVRLGLSYKEATQGIKRHVREQPLALKGKCVFHIGATINERRCAEAMHHMVNELEILKNLQVEIESDLDRSQSLQNFRDRNRTCSRMAEEELCSTQAV
jgi:hypothetical protein